MRKIQSEHMSAFVRSFGAKKMIEGFNPDERLECMWPGDKISFLEARASVAVVSEAINPYYQFLLSHVVDVFCEQALKYQLFSDLPAGRSQEDPKVVFIDEAYKRFKNGASDEASRDRASQVAALERFIAFVDYARKNDHSISLCRHVGEISTLVISCGAGSLERVSALNNELIQSFDVQQIIRGSLQENFIAHLQEATESSPLSMIGFHTHHVNTLKKIDLEWSLGCNFLYGINVSENIYSSQVPTDSGSSLFGVYDRAVLAFLKRVNALEYWLSCLPNRVAEKIIEELDARIKKHAVFTSSVSYLIGDEPPKILLRFLTQVLNGMPQYAGDKALSDEVIKERLELLLFNSNAALCFGSSDGANRKYFNSGWRECFRAYLLEEIVTGLKQDATLRLAEVFPSSLLEKRLTKAASDCLPYCEEVEDGEDPFLSALNLLLVHFEMSVVSSWDHLRLPVLAEKIKESRGLFFSGHADFFAREAASLYHSNDYTEAQFKSALECLLLFVKIPSDMMDILEEVPQSSVIQASITGTAVVDLVVASFSRSKYARRRREGFPIGFLDWVISANGLKVYEVLACNAKKLIAAQNPTNSLQTLLNNVFFKLCRESVLPVANTAPTQETKEADESDDALVLIDRLISAGFDINQTLDGNNSLLSLVSNEGNVRVVELLLAKGVDVYGNGLDEALENKPIIHALVKAQRDKTDELYAACQNSRLAKVQELLAEGGVHVNQANKFGKLSLHAACLKNHPKIVSVLLEHGADMTRVNKYGQTVLNVSCRSSNVEVIQVLFAKGADAYEAGLDDALEGMPAIKVLVQEKRDEFNQIFSACQKAQLQEVQELLGQSDGYVNKFNKDGESLLYVACLYGHKEVVELLLAKGASVKKAHKYDLSPLFIACLNGRKAVVELFLKNGADVNQLDKFGTSMLYGACKYGKEDVVALLLEYGADVKQVDKDGKSLLSQACEKGYVAVVQLLVENGAVSSKPNKFHWRPLYLACEKGHTEVVRVLLDNGADVNGRASGEDYSYGGWPLSSACEMGHAAVVALLLENGADLRSRLSGKLAHYVNDPTIRALIQAEKEKRNQLIAASSIGELGLVRELLDQAGMHINHVNKDGQTALYAACEHGQVEVVELLLFHDANINSTDHPISSLLSIAAHAGHVKIVALLFKKSVSMNLGDPSLNRLLHAACSGGHIEVLEFLLEKGADVNQVNKHGRVPLEVACKHGDREVVGLLLAHSANVNLTELFINSLLLIACRWGHVKISALLLEKGADVNYADSVGGSPLSYACTFGHKEVAELLLENSASVHGADKPPLYFACERGDAKVVELLLKKGADVNRTHGYGITSSPLGVACKRGHVKVVEILLEKGVSQSRCYSNPLVAACAGGHVAVVEALLVNQFHCRHHFFSAGIYHSPLDAACYEGHEEIVKILLLYGFDLCEKGLDRMFRRNSSIRDLVGQQKRKAELIAKLFSACKDGELEKVRALLLDGNVHINQRDVRHNTALFVACRYNHLEVIEFLLEKGAHCTKQAKDKLLEFLESSRGLTASFCRTILRVPEIKINSRLAQIFLCVLVGSKVRDNMSLVSCLEMFFVFSKSSSSLDRKSLCILLKSLLSRLSWTALLGKRSAVQIIHVLKTLILKNRNRGSEVDAASFSVCYNVFKIVCDNYIDSQKELLSQLSGDVKYIVAKIVSVKQMQVLMVESPMDEVRAEPGSKLPSLRACARHLFRWKKLLPEESRGEEAAAESSPS